jgi:fumarate reductase subunit C
VLALCVVVHLVTMIVATRGGVSAAEIVARLRGSQAWLMFYLVFVVAVAIHAPLGLRAIVREWTSWRGRHVDLATSIAALLLLALGLRAIIGLYV